jgi:signal transduction histidine kinase
LPRALDSLRFRLTAAAAVAILAAVVVLAMVTVLVVGHQLRSSLDGALRQRAQDVAQLAVSAPAVLQDPGALESTASGRQLVVEVVDARGRLLARSLALGARLLPQDALVRAALRGGRTGAEDIQLGGTPMRMYVAPIAQAGGPAAGGAVLVAADTGDITHTVDQLIAVVTLSGVGVVLVATLGAALLTRRGLAPLRRLVAAAGEIERTADPSQRLPESGLADEIGRLTGVLNRMLASLAEARAGERRFLADASHELRTPVTALLGNVEYASRHGASPEVLADLRQDTERLARLVDALLVLERAGGSAIVRQPTDLVALARAVAEEHDPGRVRVHVLEEGESVVVKVDEEGVRRAVGNLVENGLVHGPPDGTVTVAVHQASGWAQIQVSDEGPGPSRTEELFERFWRAPEASGRPGSGLGLAIAAAVAAQHGGGIRVEGSRFTLDLLAPPVP